MVGIMQIKAKGLNIEYQNGHIGFLLTEDAVKEFCDYKKIQYDDKDIHTRVNNPERNPSPVRRMEITF